MFKHLIKMGVTVSVLCLAQSLYAQYAAEVFIPMGQSPGLSGKFTIIGTVDAVNAQTKTLSLSDDTERYNLKVSDSTHLWLDRSHLKLNNSTKTLQDIKSGMAVEVKFIDNKKGAGVEWIKFRPDK